MKKNATQTMADTVWGHSYGFSIDLADTDEHAYDLKAYIGHYVKIIARGGTISYCWSTAAANILNEGDADDDQLGTADYVDDGSFSFEVVDDKNYFFHAKASAASVRLTVLPK